MTTELELFDGYCSKDGFAVLDKKGGTVVGMVQGWRNDAGHPVLDVWVSNNQMSSDIPLLVGTGEDAADRWVESMRALKRAGRLVPYADVAYTHPGVVRVVPPEGGAHRLYRGRKHSGPSLAPGTVYSLLIEGGEEVPAEVRFRTAEEVEKMINDSSAVKVDSLLPIEEEWVDLSDERLKQVFGSTLEKRVVVVDEHAVERDHHATAT